MSKQITIGDYLLTRLQELGIAHIFGVPGDYNLTFLDQIMHCTGLKWVGNCNELNAAYAADGYARIKGAGAVVTTFGVGELSAINGISGSYAEIVPVVHIVGAPSTQMRNNKALIHHTLGDGRFSVFADMYKLVTAAQTLLSVENAADEIDRVLRECWIKKQPVYIALPIDLTFKTIAAPNKSLNLNFPASNPNAIQEICNLIATKVRQAQAPVILIDAYAQRFPMKNHIAELLENTGLPFATMNMSKALFNETHPQFIGNYCGDFSGENVQEKIEQSDCLIIFGSLLSDLNSGGFTAKIDTHSSIEIHAYFARVGQTHYERILFCDVIPALSKQLKDYQFKEKIASRKIETPSKKIKAKKITQDLFWQMIPQALEKNCNIIAEAGTTMFGALQLNLPDGALFISQNLWGSIGYTLGALLGTCIANPKRQNVLFIGDGSMQLTVQELSTMLREKLNPTIFLINNGGYSIERALHDEKISYNDVQPWNYTTLPKMFGNNVWSVRVKTVAELESAIKKLKQHKRKLKLIEVMMSKTDYPELLKKISSRFVVKT